MKIKRAVTSQDHDALHLLQSVILPGDRPCKTDHGAWWLVEEDGEPIAFAGIRPSLQWIDTMYLCRSGVLPEHRGNGIQRRLVCVRERYARTMRMNWLISDTTQNPASANTLARCGFRMFEPSRPWGNRCTLYWRKRL